MENKKNIIKVYTTSNGAELNISSPSTKQVISATNNRAQYFAEQAKKYRDEAKLHRDNAKYYAEQNSDVTFEYIDNIRLILENQIETKQDIGNYALKEELPQKISELENDAEYVNKTSFNTTVEDLKLPSQKNCEGKVLMSDGQNEYWESIKTQAVTKNNISNCLLEVPQNVKYTLTNGTLTIKAGTVVIVPYGTEDKTNEHTIGSIFLNNNFIVRDTQFTEGKFFVWAELQQDTSYPSTFATGSRNVVLNLNNAEAYGVTLDFVASGTTTDNSIQYFYNSNENLIYQLGIATCYSLPLGFGDYIENSGYNNFTAFQGFGYIGSIVWADKGLKCLVPNGRNESGDLNNIEATNTKLTTITVGPNQTNNSIRFRSNSLSLGTLFYKEDTNYNYPNTNYTEFRSFMEIGKYSSDANGKIQSFQAKLPFRAVDYNDFNNTPHVIESYSKGSSGYRVWSDKYCEQWGTVNLTSTNEEITITLLKEYRDSYGCCLTSPCNVELLGGGVTYGTSAGRFVDKNKIIIKVGATNTYPIHWKTNGYLS